MGEGSLEGFCISHSGMRRDMTFVADEGASPSPRPTSTLDTQSASSE